jgi:hypothetical protein
MSHAAFLPAAAAAAAAAAAGKPHLWSSDKEILVSHVVVHLIRRWMGALTFVRWDGINLD